MSIIKEIKELPEISELLLKAGFEFEQGGFGDRTNDLIKELKGNDSVETLFTYEPNSYRRDNIIFYYTEAPFNHCTLEIDEAVEYEGDFNDDILLRIKQLVRNNTLDNLLD